MEANNGSVLTKLAVTSIKFLSNSKYILAGIGGDLYVFENNSKLVAKIVIFETSSIHGILYNNTKHSICVFGGRHIAVLSTLLSTPNSRFHCEQKWRFNDWVLSCQWVGAHDQLAVLSAHNNLILWDCSSGSQIAQVSCAQKCILYSATILADNGWSNTVVLAGTVFQEISIWTVNPGSSLDCPVIHSLKSHNGVIFSVSYDKRARLISSTSDDRSVRVWSVVTSVIGDLLAEDWKSASVTLLLTVFGHTARVWCSYILADRNIVSVGEDSQVCLWGRDGRAISRQVAHQGAGIWCMDVCESQSLVVTGGGDGGISLWPLNPHPLTAQCLPSPGGTPRQVVLLDNCRVLAILDEGSLVLYGESLWSHVYKDERISSYCILEVSPSKELIALGTICGDIIVFKGEEFSTVIDESIGGGRIFSLHWLDESSLLVCQGEGNLSVWSNHKFVLSHVGNVHLPLCKERQTTSAVKIEHTVVYGDRAGNIHSSPITTPPQHPKEVVQTVHKAHSRLGVCSLAVLNGQVWSCGRDSTVKQFTVFDHRLTLAASVKLPVSWLGSVSTSQLFGPVVLAFHESNMEIWSVKGVRRLASLPCGGGHRSWCWSVQEDQLSFSFLKDHTAHVLQCPLLKLARPMVKEGFHAKEINSMSMVCDGWIASGGEDGSVRMSHLSAYGWTTQAVQTTHVSSVRAVHVCTLKHRTLLISAGARAQMKIWDVNVFADDVSMMEVNSVMLREEKRGRHWLDSVPAADPDTRYMDLHTVTSSDTCVWVLAACSDSYLRLFSYDIENNRVKLAASVNSSQHCLLRVTASLVNGKVVAVTGGSNGCVTFWDLQYDQPVLAGVQRIHQCGVNGLSVYVVNDRSLLVASGGDDAKLALTHFLLSESPIVVQRVASWTSSSLHTSVITGVHLFRDWIVCCSGDQRVSLLSWSLSADPCLSVELMSQKTCSVPDLKGLCLLHNNEYKIVVGVYGVGLEVLELFIKKT